MRVFTCFCTVFHYVCSKVRCVCALGSFTVKGHLFSIVLFSVKQMIQEELGRVQGSVVICQLHGIVFLY